MEKLEWKPEVEVVRFADTDIITASEVSDPEELPPLIFDMLGGA